MVELTATIRIPKGRAVFRNSPWLTLACPIVQSVHELVGSMQKGRRTEIDFLNGLVVREGEKVGISCRANAVLTDLVTRVERGELKADPRHITELRLN